MIAVDIQVDPHQQQIQCLNIDVIYSPRRSSLSNVLDCDETRGMSVSFHFTYSRANRRATFLFTIVGLIIQIVTQLLFTTKLIVLKVKT